MRQRSLSHLPCPTRCSGSVSAPKRSPHGSTSEVVFSTKRGDRSSATKPQQEHRSPTRPAHPAWLIWASPPSGPRPERNRPVDSWAPARLSSHQRTKPLSDQATASGPEVVSISIGGPGCECRHHHQASVLPCINGSGFSAHGTSVLSREPGRTPNRMHRHFGRGAISGCCSRRSAASAVTSACTVRLTARDGAVSVTVSADVRHGRSE